jgi:hypothetical protein
MEKNYPFFAKSASGSRTGLAGQNEKRTPTMEA